MNIEDDYTVNKGDIYNILLGKYTYISIISIYHIIS